MSKTSVENAHHSTSLLSQVFNHLVLLSSRDLKICCKLTNIHCSVYCTLYIACIIQPDPIKESKVITIHTDDSHVCSWNEEPSWNPEVISMFPKKKLSQRWWFFKRKGDDDIYDGIVIIGITDVRSDRDSISGSVQLLLDEATEPWGIKVTFLPSTPSTSSSASSSSSLSSSASSSSQPPPSSPSPPSSWSKTQVERLEIKDARLPVQLQVWFFHHQA